MVSSNYFYFYYNYYYYNDDDDDDNDDTRFYSTQLLLEFNETLNEALVLTKKKEKSKHIPLLTILFPL